MLIDVLARHFPTSDTGRVYQFVTDNQPVYLLDRPDGSRVLTRRPVADGLWQALHKHGDWAGPGGPRRHYWHLRLERETWAGGPDYAESGSGTHEGGPRTADLAQALLDAYAQAQTDGHT